MQLTPFFLRLLLWSKVIAGQKLIGKLATSVSYGHIHAFLSASAATERAREMVTLFDGLEEQIVTKKEKRNFDKLKYRHEHDLMATMEGYEELLQAFSPVTNNTISAQRDKRHPLVIVAAAALAVLVIVNFGLSVANRVQLEQLMDTVEQNRDDFDKLVTTIEQTNGKINQNFQVLRNDIRQLRNDTNALQDNIFLKDLSRRMALAHVGLRSHLRELTTAVYMAYSGTLHPSLMPVPKLKMAYTTIQNMARRKGGQLIDTIDPMELLFSMPVTITTNQTGFHLLLPVPVVPAGMQILDLYSLSVPTKMLDNQTTITLEVGNGLIAASPL